MQVIFFSGLTIYEFISLFFDSWNINAVIDLLEA